MMWAAAEAYEQFMGRWSAVVAHKLFDLAPMPQGGRCLDIGCGVGSLSRVVIERLEPRQLVGVDSSAAFLGRAGQAVPELQPVQADAVRLPFSDSTFDIAVSGLVLNFVPEAARALAEVTRVLRPGGMVCTYVWDYDHPDFFLARLWAAVAAVGGQRAAGDERGRWPVCTPEGLAETVDETGLVDVRVVPIVIDTTFSDAESLWNGFQSGIGPSGQALRAFDTAARARLRQWLDDDLPSDEDGTVRLTARALALIAVRR